jgi:hypothetical protein
MLPRPCFAPNEALITLFAGSGSGAPRFDFDPTAMDTNA